MNRRRKFVTVGVVLALVILGAGIWEVTFDVRPSTRLARRLGFGFFEAGANRALEHAIETNPSRLLAQLESLATDPDPELRIAADFAREQAEHKIEVVSLLKATEVVGREFRSEGARSENWPRLATLLRESSPVDEYLRMAIELAVRPAAAREGDSAAAFLAVAQDAAVATANRQSAVIVIGKMGESAGGVLPDLLRLAEEEPDVFREVVGEARIHLAPADIIAWYAFQLESPDRGYFLHNFNVGDEGRGLGPAVTKFLGDPDGHIRVAAARALSLIGYQEGIPELLPLLSDPDDWKVVSMAALTLGKLQASVALPELERVALEHWCPFVRHDAQLAIDEIRAPSGAVEREIHRRDRGWEGWNSGSKERVPVLSSGSGALSQWQASRMSHRVQYARYASAFASEEVIEWDHEPSCGIKFAGGYLLGVDRGEFGFGVLFVRTGHEATYFPTNCVTAFHRMPFGVVAVTYGAMGGDGYACVFDLTGDGKVDVRRFIRLFGRVEKSGLLPNGDLYLDGLIITTDEEIRLAD